MARLFCIFLVFLGVFRLPAQVPLFRPLTLKDWGDAHVNTLYQDKEGWIWMGTDAGLFCYDGLDIRSFFLDDSVDDKNVSAVFEWGGYIWAGLRSGNISRIQKKTGFWANYIDPNPETSGNTTNTLQIWTPEEGTPAKPITAFCADSSGNLWFSTYGEGIYCLKNKRLYQFDAKDDGLAGDDVYALTCDAQGRVWASSDAGISTCSLDNTLKKSVKNLRVPDGLPDEIVPFLLSQAPNTIWIGTDEHGVAYFDILSNTFTNLTPNWAYGAVNSMAVYDGSELWIGTNGDGLLLLNQQTGNLQPLPEKHPLRKTKIKQLLKDREGLLWVLNDNGAIWTANLKFSLLETPFSNAQAILANPKKHLWIGTATGLFLYDNLSYKPVLDGQQNIVSLIASPEGYIIAGTFGGGLFILSPEGKILHHLTEKNGLPNGSVLSMAYSNKKLWLATLGGVTEVDWDDQHPSIIGKITHQGELGSSYVYKVFKDSKGHLWFGTDGKGLILLQNGQFTKIKEANGLPLKTIYSIAEDNEGKIWFTTDKQGLFCYDGSTFRQFTTKEGLHSLNFIGLASDGNGELIIAYTDGYDIIKPHSGHIAFHNHATGIPTSEPALNALYMDGFGQVWSAGQQGITKISAFQSSYAFDPLPHIRSVSLFLNPIDFQNKSSFAYDQNYFFFEFAGLWFTNSAAVQYRYKLEGFDPDWKITKDRKASYPNLPPGNYTLRLQSSEQLRFGGVPETTYSFSIRPPIWSRWWFILGIAAGVAGLLAYYVRYRELRLREEAILKKEMVQAQFETLKSQINPHFLFNSFNTLSAIIEESPSAAVQYVEHLSDFYRSILEHREKDFIPIKEEIELVKNFDFLLKKRFENNYSLHFNLSEPVSGFVMPLSIQMLVENAVKHNIISKAKPLVIEISIENNDFVVVKNNIQRKITPEVSTNFGLQSLRNRYEMLGKKQISVNDDGQYFTVKIPIVQLAT